MEQNLKGKSVTTSVPSIAIKFHANAEQLEEFFPSVSDDEQSNSLGGATSTSTLATGTSEPETSPLKLLPKLVKRSTSIDITPIKDSSPPTTVSSDPWRFFSDIKGKITKSVEDKLTEIKSRNNCDDSSPSKIPSSVKSATINKEGSSSVSDSAEDLSESSISKTCGILSTTEGVEMSSSDEEDEDETPSIDRDKDPQIVQPTPSGSSSGTSLAQRFRILNRSSDKEVDQEGTVPSNGLAKLYNINMERIEQALPDDPEEIESGVEAALLIDDDYETQIKSELEETILKSLAGKYDNIRLDPDGVVEIESIGGPEIRKRKFLPDVGGGGSRREEAVTVFAPQGFVDLRERTEETQSNYYLPIFVVSVSCVFYFLAQMYSNYLAGFLVGTAVTYLYHWTISALHTAHNPSAAIGDDKNGGQESRIYEIQAAKEYQPTKKYEGWMNEFPEPYNPHTYHISQTQSVYLKLQGNLLRVSHCRSKVPKRALWNEPEIKPIFTHHRVYNLLGAKVSLLPAGLAKKKNWSKKYPICIVLSNNQMNFDCDVAFKKMTEDDSTNEKTNQNSQGQAATGLGAKLKAKKTFQFRKKPKYPVLPQRFSKLTEEEREYELDSETSRASTPSPDLSDGIIHNDEYLETCSMNKPDLYDDDEEDLESFADEWSTLTTDDRISPENKLFLFGRTDREKEDWFRRFTKATHKGAEIPSTEVFDLNSSISDVLIGDALLENDYVKYMTLLTKVKFDYGVFACDQRSPKPNKSVSKKKKKAEEGPSSSPDEPRLSELMWVNAFLGRVLYDCLHDPDFTRRVKDRIERKLAAIKLPYFIEELLVTELSLGNTPPFIVGAARPKLDERGLWIDLDVNYEGFFVMTLQTKINLMKLKQPPVKPENRLDGADFEKSAMFHSDIDDSAESSSDDDANLFQQQSTSGYSNVNNAPVLDSTGYPVLGLGGSSNKSKKFIKIVDRITESRFFQAATENRYIKKAMEGVSNTDLRLKVELRELVGTLVLNIPPPPSDRVWIGFRPTPDLVVSAHPIVGERNITFLKVTSWIEKKLLQEFQKVMVIPNMEDFAIPVMCQRLPH